MTAICSRCHTNQRATPHQWCSPCCHAHWARLKKEKAEFPLEERDFGPSLRDIFGEDWRRESGYEIPVNASDFKSMAHLMHALGAFSSVSEARRNGHNKPIETGVHLVRIRGYIHRLVIEEPQRFIAVPTHRKKRRQREFVVDSNAR